MSEPANVLFMVVSDIVDRRWSLVLQDALADLGEIQILSEEDAVRAVSREIFAVIFIDAGAVYDAALLTRRLRVSRPETRIIVVTASPTWEYARQALQAGAADYIRKTLNPEELRTKVLAVMEIPPSKRPI